MLGILHSQSSNSLGTDLEQVPSDHVVKAAEAQDADNILGTTRRIQERLARQSTLLERAAITPEVNKRSILSCNDSEICPRHPPDCGCPPDA